MAIRDIRRAYLYVIVVAIVIILFGLVGFLKPIYYILEKGVSTISTPTYTIVTRLKELPLWNEKKVLVAEISRLSEETRELQSITARMTLLERENQAIRDALFWAEDSEREYIVAKILGRPLHAPRTYLILNQGSSEGVFEGLSVIIDDDILVGVVVDVQDHTSYLRLLTDNESVVSAKLLKGQEPVGTVLGELGLSLRLTLIPQYLNPDIDELVVTSGLDELIPPNIIIGTIDNNIQNTDDFFKEVSIKTLYDVNELNIVSIVIDSI